MKLIHINKEQKTSLYEPIVMPFFLTCMVGKHFEYKKH